MRSKIFVIRVEFRKGHPEYVGDKWKDSKLTEGIFLKEEDALACIEEMKLRYRLPVVYSVAMLSPTILRWVPAEGGYKGQVRRKYKSKTGSYYQL